VVLRAQANKQVSLENRKDRQKTFFTLEKRGTKKTIASLTDLWHDMSRNDSVECMNSL
jgi:hypothetical protein